MPKGVPKNGKRKKRADAGKSRKGGLMGSTVTVSAKFSKFQDEDPSETLEQAEKRIKERFDIMHLISAATVAGKNTAFIISGPPGLGKSYGVTEILEKASTRGIKSAHISGFVRATGLFKTLYEMRDKKSVVVLDDADSIFSDEASLNILKIACDTTRTRTISWLAETRMEDEGGDKLPRSFQFEGSVIFITNLAFDDLIERGSRLSPHLEALISRAHYLDLSLKSKRDYMIRIRQVVNGGMLANLGMKDKDIRMVMAYIENKSDRLRELSLRMVLKVANLTRIHANWETIANGICVR